MQAHKYCWQQILLHWISALVIIWVLISGFSVAYLNVAPCTYHRVAFINVALTTLFIPVFLLRWLLRLTQPKPRSLHGDSKGQRIAHVVHEGLYWTTLVVLLSGVLMMERAIDVFGWFSIAPLLSDPFWHSVWFKAHIASCLLLAVGVSMHIAAVVLHELSGRRVLRRMLP
ncbi:cytochrome b [Pseudomonas sp. NPDC089407]|uniref:cytochrome b n=1 Tax=Pseudomonas sp. NPDC089407 TaxID=3364464 RepID=UPI00384A705A